MQDLESLQKAVNEQHGYSKRQKATMTSRVGFELVDFSAAATCFTVQKVTATIATA